MYFLFIDKYLIYSLPPFTEFTAYNDISAKISTYCPVNSLMVAEYAVTL